MATSNPCMTQEKIMQNLDKAISLAKNIGMNPDLTWDQNRLLMKQAGLNLQSICGVAWNTALKAVLDELAKNECLGAPATGFESEVPMVLDMADPESILMAKQAISEVEIEDIFTNTINASMVPAFQDRFTELPLDMVVMAIECEGEEQCGKEDEELLNLILEHHTKWETSISLALVEQVINEHLKEEKERVEKGMQQLGELITLVAKRVERNRRRKHRNKNGSNVSSKLKQLRVTTLTPADIVEAKERMEKAHKAYLAHKAPDTGKAHKLLKTNKARSSGVYKQAIKVANTEGIQGTRQFSGEQVALVMERAKASGRSISWLQAVRILQANSFQRNRK